MSNYRNKRILAGANGAPCMRCAIQDGTIVAAHSNQYRDGRGYAFKSHDFRVAYLCNGCHYYIDYDHNASKALRTEEWEQAHRKTIAYIFLQEIVK